MSAVKNDRRQALSGPSYLSATEKAALRARHGPLGRDRRLTAGAFPYPMHLYERFTALNEAADAYLTSEYSDRSLTEWDPITGRRER